MYYLLALFRYEDPFLHEDYEIVAKKIEELERDLLLFLDGKI